MSLADYSAHLAHVHLNRTPGPHAVRRCVFRTMRHRQERGCKCGDPDQSRKEFREDLTAIDLSSFALPKNKRIS